MIRKIILFLMPALFSLTVLSITPSAADQYDDLEKYLYPISSENTISMDFTNADFGTVLKVFSQQSGLNFIASSDITAEQVNLYMENVPVEAALERILAANNLTYEINQGSNIFVVKKLEAPETELMTRVYPLKFATVPSSKLLSTLNFENEDSGGGGGEDAERQGLVGAIESILTEHGTVIEDIRTNSLIVSDIPSQFPLIEQTIARLDIRVPQILIEAEILDISKTTADLLGAKFGSTPVNFTGPERSTIFPFDQNRAIRDLPKTGGQGFEFGEAEYSVGTLSLAGLTVALQFLRTQTDTRNLARPRIRTLNNDTAQIAISTDEAIGLASSTTASEGTSTSVAEAERVETGVFLRVTPQANIQTKEITMAIEPKVIQARTGGTFGGQTFKDPEERGSKSVLRVNDGDTIVLGGLLRTDFDQTKTKVPVLGQIPVLGAPFRHKDKDESQRELVIFITPHILEENLIFSATSPEKQKIAREQTLSPNRKKAVEKDLSNYESRRTSSYR